jgi:hypothetical protein
MESGLKLAAQIALRPPKSGEFVVPHGLSALPKVVILQSTNGGPIWWQTPLRFDEKNLYLIALSM